MLEPTQRDCTNCAWFLPFNEDAVCIRDEEGIKGWPKGLTAYTPPETDENIIHLMQEHGVSNEPWLCRNWNETTHRYRKVAMGDFMKTDTARQLEDWFVHETVGPIENLHL